MELSNRSLFFVHCKKAAFVESFLADNRLQKQQQDLSDCSNTFCTGRLGVEIRDSRQSYIISVSFCYFWSLQLTIILISFKLMPLLHCLYHFELHFRNLQDWSLICVRKLFVRRNNRSVKLVVSNKHTRKLIQSLSASKQMMRLNRYLLSMK